MTTMRWQQRRSSVAGRRLPLTLLLAFSVPAPTFAQVTPAASAAPSSSTAASSSAAASANPAAPTAGAASANPAASAGGSPPSSGPCQEQIPEGKQRPEVKEVFPSKGVSGHQAVLEITVTHGEAERVLPGALQIQGSDHNARAVEGAHFLFPRSTGPSAPQVERSGSGAATQTLIRIPLVPLPKKPGRHLLTLPALPISMSRASGEVITFCTQPHTIQVEDPIANQPMASPMGNAEPRRQDELWLTLRNIVYGSLVGLFLASLIAIGWLLWSKRPKKLPPPPPPKPAWAVALEELLAIQQAQLIEQLRLGDHFDRVSSTLRKYLGGCYGFDGLESTTSEILKELRKNQHPSLTTDTRAHVDRFLEQCDLVKFADVEPTEAECRGLWERAKQVVDTTMPKQIPNAAGTKSKRAST